MTGHTTPGVVSSIVSSEALQADLQGDLQALQRQEEILQVQEERSPQGDGFVQNEDHEDDYEDRENHHDDHDEEHEENQPSREGTNQMFDSYWPKPTGTEAITISSQDSSKEGVYEVRYEDNGPDPEVNEPEVISDSDSGEEQDYPVDRFIPIQGDSEDPEGHEEHPSVEIVEPEGLYAYEEEYENEDEVQEGNEEYDHPPAWPSLSGQPRRISSSSDEVICLDSD